MRPLSFLLAILALTLAGCETPGKPDPILSSAEAAPIAPAINCQPTVLARSEPEPAPPPGLTIEGFYNPLQDWVFDALGEEGGKAWWKWFTTTYPKWAREGWVRIDKARALAPCGGGDGGR